jgi:uracil phosphoribosyltransferase
MADSFCMDKNEMSGLHIVEHPLVQHKLTQMRQKDTTSQVFRTLLNEISLLLAYEVTRELPIKELEIETPLVKTKMPHLSEMPSVVSILRAGNGLLEGVLQVIPNARVGHVGLYRDHETLEAVEYYCKFPPLNGGMTIVVDPMLATGNSACAALTRVKEENPASVRFLCLLAAPEGVKALNTEHPDVEIWTASLDERLNEKGYILPGLGDAGDRIYGTT